MIRSKQVDATKNDLKTEYKKKLFELKVLEAKAKEEGRDTTEIDEEIDKLYNDYRPKRTRQIIEEKKDIMKKRKQI